MNKSESDHSRFDPRKCYGLHAVEAETLPCPNCGELLNDPPPPIIDMFDDDPISTGVMFVVIGLFAIAAILVYGIILMLVLR